MDEQSLCTLVSAVCVPAVVALWRAWALERRAREESEKRAAVSVKEATSQHIADLQAMARVSRAITQGATSAGKDP